MEFKAGDRVHVLRYNGEDVDFYGTLKYVDKCMANLFDCTIKKMRVGLSFYQVIIVSAKTKKTTSS